MTDVDLLADYVRTRSPDALSAVVRCYVDLVYSTARRMVGDPNLADDVTQATFLVLMKKADRVDPRTLPGWLVNTTRLAAMEARRATALRTTHETRAATMRTESQQSATDEPTAETLLPLLDDALSRLSDADRTAVVLRFLQGRSFAEVGDATGSTEEAARKRVGRAVEKLRAIFMKHGVVPTVGGLMVVLAAQQAQAAPSGVVAAAVAMKSSTQSALISKGVLTVIASGKIKLALVMAAALFVVGGIGVGAVAIHRALAQTPPTTQPVDPPLAGGAVAREVYVGGDVERPGVYSVTGRVITVKQALVSAGVSDAKVQADYVQLIRRAGGKDAVIYRNVTLSDIFAGREKDLPLEPNDLLSLTPQKITAKATFNDGTAIELLAVGAFGDPADTWWSPDGPLAAPPAKDLKIDRQVGVRQDPHEVVRAFAMRFTPGQPGFLPTLRAIDEWGNCAGDPSWWEASEEGPQFSRAPFDKQQKITVMRYELASGAWVTQGTVAANQFIAGMDITIGKIHVTGVSQTPGDLRVQVDCPSVNRREADAQQVVVTTLDGKTVVGEIVGYLGSKLPGCSGYLYGFAKLRIVTIKSVSIQTRPFDRFAEFRNVSVVAGTASDLRILTSDQPPGVLISYFKAIQAEDPVAAARCYAQPSERQAAMVQGYVRRLIALHRLARVCKSAFGTESEHSIEADDKYIAFITEMVDSTAVVVDGDHAHIEPSKTATTQAAQFRLFESTPQDFVRDGGGAWKLDVLAKSSWRRADGSDELTAGERQLLKIEAQDTALCEQLANDVEAGKFKSVADVKAAMQAEQKQIRR